MTSKIDKPLDRPSWDRVVVIRNRRYVGAKTPGDVVRAMARFKQPVKNQARKGKEPA